MTNDFPYSKSRHDGSVITPTLVLYRLVRNAHLVGLNVKTVAQWLDIRYG